MFHAMDKDGSADISIEEFTDFLRERSEQQEAEQKDPKTINKDGKKQQDDQKAAASKPIVKKTAVRKTVNSKSTTDDAWSRTMGDLSSLHAEKSTLAEPLRLSATSEDILDRSGGALVLSKENKDANEMTPRKNMSRENSWNASKNAGGNESSARDSPCRTSPARVPAQTDTTKQIHAIPRPLVQAGAISRSNSEGSYEDIDVAALTSANDDVPDSVAKGRIVISPPVPKSTLKTQQKSEVTKMEAPKSSTKPDASNKPDTGKTAQRFLDKFKKTKSENISAPKVNQDSASGGDLSKSVDFSLPRKEPQDMHRSKSENSAARRPPLPLKPSLSGIINSKITSFHIRNKSQELEELPGGVSAAASYLPPPQTEIGAVMGVVLEGWLEKKSSVTGLFQKRFVVLAFGKASHMRGGLSSAGEDFMELRIFKRAVESAWGNAPIEVKL